MDIYVIIALCAILVPAVITDLRSQKIPNILTFPAMLAGLAYHFAMGGTDGFLHSLAGFGVGFGFMLVPFLLGFMGAGDVKLMAAVGAWLGPYGAFAAYLAACLFGGVYALILMAGRSRILKETLGNLWTASWLFVVTRKFDYAPSHEAGTLPKLCYGVAIAAGTMAAVAWTACRSQVAFF